MAGIEEALRVEVSEVCRNYDLQVWNEALNQAGFKAFSALKRADSVCYPPAIHAPSFASSKAETTSEVAEFGKDSPTKVLVSSDSPFEEAQQPKIAKKEANTTKGVAPNTIKPLVVPQDLPQEKEVPPKMEIVLVTLPVPAKGDHRGKGPKALHSPNPPRPQ